MIIQILINIETLDATCKDPSVTINEIKRDDGHMMIEISNPDPELTMIPMTPPMEL